MGRSRGGTNDVTLGTPIAEGAQGRNVGLAQQVLVGKGLSVAADELRRKFIGPSTGEAVTSWRRSHYRLQAHQSTQEPMSPRSGIGRNKGSRLEEVGDISISHSAQ